MQTKKIGIVGVGAIAQAVHIPGILACPSLELGALCDTNPQRLDEMSKKYNIAPENCFSTTKAMLANGSVDALDICTPNDAHFDAAQAAISSSIPYSLEKPITLSFEQAKILCDGSKAKNLANMVCFSYRFKAAARYARHIIHSGEIGELYHANMHYFQAWALPVYDTPLYWRFEAGRSGSGTLGDLGSHALDLVRFVTGQEYHRVCSHNGTFIHERKRLDGQGMAKVDVDDFTHILAQMDQGLPAVIQSTRFAYGRGNYQRMEVYGSLGALIYELDVEPGLDRLSICSGAAMRRGNNFVELSIPWEYKADQTHCFADILFGHPDGLSATIDDGLKNQQVLDAVIASSAAGEWINIKGV